MNAVVYISSEVDLDSDVEVLEVLHAQVQDVNSANIGRAEPQGGSDNENIEETQENESEENVNEAGVEIGEDDERERGN